MKDQFGDLLEPGFRKIFDDKYAEVPMMLEKIYKTNTSDKQDEKDSSVSGFGLLNLTPPGRSIVYEDPVVGFDKVYTHLSYKKGFKIPKEMWEDDQYNIMNKKPAALGKAARRTAEYYAAANLNGAFSTSYAGGDAKPLASTSHPRADGGTAQSNASAVGLKLSEDNMETALLAIKGQLDEKGMIIDVMPNRIIVPPALSKAAHIIVDSVGRSGTSDHDVNVYKSQFEIVEWAYLTSSTAWFLEDTSTSELNWFWRIKPEFKQDDMFDTDTACFKVRERFSCGASDWHGFWGSKGDGAAYAG